MAQSHTTHIGLGGVMPSFSFSTAGRIIFGALLQIIVEGEDEAIRTKF
jgi:hypothetical protein